jgi:hypothetical protein
LDLRFADNKTLGDAYGGGSLVTFTRASSGTYVGSDGLLKTAATDVPRFDHNPTTGESLGLLVEEARTNLFTRSEEFNDAAWTRTNSTITANAATAPDGTLTADKHIPDNGATIGVGASDTRVFQSPSATSGTVYTFSIYAKASEYNQIQFSLIATPTVTARFSLNLGTVLSGTGATITPAGDGWYRCAIPVTAGVTGGLAVRWSAQSSIATIGDGTSGIFAWGAQFEAGAFPSSYIPTTSATVTRAADVASITGAAFSSFYNQTEGTVFSDCVGTFSSTQVLVNIAATAANTATSAISLASNLTSSQKRVRVRDAASADQASLALGGSSSGSRMRIAAAIKANDFAASLDGGAAVTDTTGTVPPVVLMEIGSAPSGVTLGTQLHRRITYWPVRLPNTSLQAITQL